MTRAQTDTPSTQRMIGGRYELLEQIGRGGMGVVWRSRDVLLERDVAVKEIQFPAGTTEDEREVLRKRVFREARAAARLTHPSVVTVYDVIEDEGQPFIVMELIDAPSLTDVVRLDGPLAPAKAAAVGLDVLSALEVAHAAGVVHRDIKPSNVMVPNQGHCELADFGIASVQDDPSVTSTGLVLGSPAYMAPEQGSRGMTSPASDLWSLGATLYFAVEGRPPFEGDGALPTLSAVMHDEPREMVHAGPMAAIISALLSKDPARRPVHRVVKAELERVITHAPSTGAAVAVSAPYPEETRADDTLQLVHTEQSANVLPPVAATAATAIAATAIAQPAQVSSSATSALPPKQASASDYDYGRPVERRSRFGLLAGLLLAALLLAGGIWGFSKLGNGGDQETPSDAVGSSASPSASADSAASAPAAVVKPPAKASATPSASVSGTPSATASATPSAAAPPASEGSVAAAPAPAPTPAPAPVAAGVPADWVPYTHPTVGYTIMRPPGWTVTDKGANTDIKDPATGAYMRVAYRTPPGADATQAWRDSEPGFRSRYPSYQRIALQPGQYRGLTNVGYWEYTYGRQRAVNLGFVLADRSYGFALNFQAPQSQWAQSQPAFEAFKASFQPPR